MSPDRHARTMLPIPDRPSPGLTTYDAKDPDTAFPPIEPLLPPDGAPNVVIVLLDDVGFGAASTFGGPCRTPTADRLAAGGLRYNRFHTTALCAPTRAAYFRVVTIIRWGCTATVNAVPGPVVEL